MSYYISIWHVSKQMETSKFHKKRLLQRINQCKHRVCALWFETLGLQIRESCDFRLWVVLLVDFFDNVVNPPQLEQAVSKARIALKDAGFQDTSPVFLAGHSLGGSQSVISCL